ncbi:MAG: ORF6N domain-containing protein [Dysgonamonadaceae bacterium]|nr:ORF6N domain-containing protein [Dysgonamonadaceae bacterium]
MDLLAIQNRIHEIRGYKVMLDFDLADMYHVETKVLNQAVKRNIDRFPSDFMFQLTNKEFTDLRSQFVTSNWGGTRYLPYAFSEHGVTMLSSVLKSKKAINTNIFIVRAFVALRQYALGYAELKLQLDNFMLETNMQFNEIYQALTELAEQKKEADKPRNPIGYQHIAQNRE